MPLSNTAAEQAVSRVVRFFEDLAPQSLDTLGDIYDDETWFKDPFNEVRGLAAVEKVYRHMYATLDAPRFVVTRRIVGRDECFLRWDFHFRFRGKPAEQTIHGASHLTLSSSGRITSHRDYWDAAEELYEKLPVVGGLMRWLKRKARG